MPFQSPLYLNAFSFLIRFDFVVKAKHIQHNWCARGQSLSYKEVESGHQRYDPGPPRVSAEDDQNTREYSLDGIAMHTPETRFKRLLRRKVGRVIR